MLDSQINMIRIGYFDLYDKRDKANEAKRKEVYGQNASNACFYTAENLYFEKAKACTTDPIWTDTEKMVFIENVVFQQVYKMPPPQIRHMALPEIVMEVTRTDDPPFYFVQKGYHCIETLQDFLSGVMAIPFTFTTLQKFQKYSDALRKLGESPLNAAPPNLGLVPHLPDDLREWIYNVKYPVFILHK